MNATYHHMNDDSQNKTKNTEGNNTTEIKEKNRLYDCKVVFNFLIEILSF